MIAEAKPNHMNIIELKHRETILENSKLNNVYIQLDDLLKELRQKDLPVKIVVEINSRIEALNLVSDSEKELKKATTVAQSEILKVLEKEMKFVPKSYYRNIWMVLGMSAIGLPIGVAFGLSIGNLGMLAIGLPIGMVIGLGLGMRMDKKALEEGRQLDFEAKY